MSTKEVVGKRGESSDTGGSTVSPTKRRKRESVVHNTLEKEISANPPANDISNKSTNSIVNEKDNSSGNKTYVNKSTNTPRHDKEEEEQRIATNEVIVKRENITSSESPSNSSLPSKEKKSKAKSSENENAKEVLKETAKEKSKEESSSVEDKECTSCSNSNEESCEEESTSSGYYDRYYDRWCRRRRYRRPNRMIPYTRAQRKLLSKSLQFCYNEAIGNVCVVMLRQLDTLSQVVKTLNTRPMGTSYCSTCNNPVLMFDRSALIADTDRNSEYNSSVGSEEDSSFYSSTGENDDYSSSVSASSGSASDSSFSRYTKSYSDEEASTTSCSDSVFED